MTLAFNPAVLPDDPVTPEPVIGNDGWFPDIDPAELRKSLRLRDDVAFERVRDAVQGGMITVALQLAGWQAARVAEGHASLEAVPAMQLGGESRFVILYRRALHAEVKADLIEGYRDTDTTGAGDRDVAALDPQIGELRRTAVHAVRDILGTGRTSIELI